MPDEEKNKDIVEDQDGDTEEVDEVVGESVQDKRKREYEEESK